MTYNINDKFYNEYEPEVAIFCNTNGYKIVELEKEIVKDVECRVFQIQEIVKTLDELQAEKIAELKAKREAYKKTIIIKDNISLADLEIGSNNYSNLMRLKYGWVQDDLDLFDSEMDNIVIKYNTIKDLINNSTLDTINSILISFED
jgi:hypothetical protein